MDRRGNACDHGVVTTFSRAVEIWTTSRSDLPQTKLLLLVVFFFVFSYVAWSASIICSMKSSVVFWVFYNTARAFRLPCGTTHKLFTNELHEGPKHLPNQENRQLWLLRRDANFETLLGLDDLLSSERSCDIFLVEPCHMFQPNFCWSTYTRPSQENCSIGQKSDEAKRACDFHKCSF